MINSGEELDCAAFKIYCLDTAKRFVQLYSWYYMPTAMHVILLHGHQVIEAIILPIGEMSEEAIEASHKIVKRFKELYTRKFSR